MWQESQEELEKDYWQETESQKNMRISVDKKFEERLKYCIENPESDEEREWLQQWNYWQKASEKKSRGINNNKLLKEDLEGYLMDRFLGTDTAESEFEKVKEGAAETYQSVEHYYNNSTKKKVIDFYRSAFYRHTSKLGSMDWQDEDGNTLHETVADVSDIFKNPSETDSAAWQEVKELLLEKGLKEKHFKVLELMTMGYKQYEIAEMLGVSDKTVRNHMKAFLKVHNENIEEINSILY